MKLLTIDTSTTACSVALTDDDRLLGENTLAGVKGQSANLFDAIEILLAASGLGMSDIDGFGVAVGPGAFTGLRCGIAAAKGLSLSTGKPVAGFSSLAMLAMNLPHTELPVCPLFDARKNELYAGLYRMVDGMPEQMMDDAALSPEALAGRLTGPTLLLGDGAARYRTQLHELLGDRALFAPPFTYTPRAYCGALLARAQLSKIPTSDSATLQPLYLRLSEAELARQSRNTP